MTKDVEASKAKGKGKPPPKMRTPGRKASQAAAEMSQLPVGYVQQCCRVKQVIQRGFLRCAGEGTGQ
jgi:hypothetical protein